MERDFMGLFVKQESPDEIIDAGNFYFLELCVIIYIFFSHMIYFFSSWINESDLKNGNLMMYLASLE